MSCRAISELMSNRLDGRLSAEQAAAMDAHLGLCVPCQHRWALLQLAESRLAQAPNVVPSADFTVRVLASLCQAPRPEGSPHRVLWMHALSVFALLGLLIAAVVALGGISLWPVLSHPAVVGKATNIARLCVSVLMAIVKALWSSFSLLDNLDVSLVGLATGLLALVLVLFWARVVSKGWQMGAGERAA